jgi:hypothetical protein
VPFRAAGPSDLVYSIDQADQGSAVSQLINEILLRFVKPLGAGLIGLAIYGLAVGLLHVTPTFETAAISYVAGAAIILLMETSPI